MDQGSSAGASPIEPEKCEFMSVAKSFLTRRKLSIQDTAKRITTESLMLFSLDLVKLFDRRYFFFISKQITLLLTPLHKLLQSLLMSVIKSFRLSAGVQLFSFKVQQMTLTGVIAIMASFMECQFSVSGKFSAISRLSSGSKKPFDSFVKIAATEPFVFVLLCQFFQSFFR